MNGFPQHCYFVLHVPIERIWYKKEFVVWEEAEWTQALEKSIRENGLISPILIDSNPVRKHREALAAGTTDEFHVYCGHHRVQAMHRIGWTYVPCVIYGGPVPYEWDPVHIPNEVRAREYFRDGVMILEHEKLAMTKTMIPEDMIYPDIPDDPYWPSSPTSRRHRAGP
jgi:hypothetical protein